MFTPTAQSLQEFYDTPLGMVACRSLRREIRTLWPREVAHPESGRDELIIGLGFATPYLTPLMKPHGSKVKSRALAFMPAAQGALQWPLKKPSRVAMTAEHHLPLPDNSVGRVLMVHSLEHAGNPKALLREIWRVMDACGQLVVIVPHRTGLWARAEKTPFGHGRPFSESQLKNLLEESMLTPVEMKSALFLPPSNFRFLIRSADWWEKGGKIAPFLGGTMIALAEKRLYATSKGGGKKVRVLAGAR